MTTIPGGTGIPEFVISPKEAPFPPAISVSKISRSSKETIAIFFFIFFSCGFSFAQSITSPLSALTITLSPSRNTSVAFFVPMTQGFCISRLTIAAWHKIPPSSVTKALAFSNPATKSAFVILATKISPFLTFFRSLAVNTIFTVPSALPLKAVCPVTFFIFVSKSSALFFSKNCTISAWRFPVTIKFSLLLPKLVNPFFRSSIIHSKS